jgi:hypothetical protein
MVLGGNGDNHGFRHHREYDPKQRRQHRRLRLLSERREVAQMTCDQCQALYINGVFCHELGCPNSKKKKKKKKT